MSSPRGGPVSARVHIYDVQYVCVFGECAFAFAVVYTVWPIDQNAKGGTQSI